MDRMLDIKPEDPRIVRYYVTDIRSSYINYADCIKGGLNSLYSPHSYEDYKEFGLCI